MKKEKQQSAVEWLEQRLKHLVEKEYFDHAKKIENEQRQKKENQFVLNMPFKIDPLMREKGSIFNGEKISRELVVGYVIKDATGTEYFFYEKDGILEYDGWSRELKQTK
jgi:hypothetical protein